MFLNRECKNNAEQTKRNVVHLSMTLCPVCRCIMVRQMISFVWMWWTPNFQFGNITYTVVAFKQEKFGFLEFMLIICKFSW